MKQTAVHRRRRRTLVAAVLMVVALIVAVVALTRSADPAAMAAAEAGTSWSIVTSAGGTPASGHESPPLSGAASRLLPAASGAGGTGSSGAQLPPVLPADAVRVHVPILMYHYVDAAPPPAGRYADSLTVRTKDFIAEMDYLVEHGHHTVSMADVYMAMARLRELPPKPVVLTFDDGGLDNYEVAYPILRERGLVGTFFVITKVVDREGHMTWDQLGEMAANGMSIESHTVGHPDLRKVSESRLKSELVDSRAAIQDAIDEPSYVLCYPAGVYNDAVIEAAKSAGYLMALTTDKGKEGDPAAIYEMNRRRVSPFMPIATFAKLVQ